MKLPPLAPGRVLVLTWGLLAYGELTLPCRRLVQARSDALRQVIEPRACGAGVLPTKCRQKQKTTEMVVFVFGGGSVTKIEL